MQATEREQGQTLLSWSGLIALLATNPYAYYALHPLCLDADALSFAVPMLLAGLAVSIWRAAGGGVADSPSRDHARQALAIEFLGYAVGMAGLVAWSLGFRVQLVAVVAGAMLGAVMPDVFLTWAVTAGSRHLDRSMARVGCACGAAAALDFAMGLADRVTMATVFFVLAMLGAVSTLVIARGLLQNSNNSKTNNNVSINESNNSIRDAVRTMLAVSLIPLLGMTVAAIFSYQRSFGLSSPNVVFGIDGEFLGLMLASLFVGGLGLARPSETIMQLVYRLIIPSAAVAFLALDAIGGAGSGLLFDIKSLIVMMLIPSLVLIALAVALTQSKTGEVPPRLVSSCVLGWVSASYLLGLLLNGQVARTDSVDAFYPGLMTFFVAMFAAYGLVELWNHRDRGGIASGDAPAATTDVDEVLRASRARMARSGGLSERETEVFGYLARGYSPAYIANVLTVAESTVRTHVKSIYRKLGVSSREELIALVESSLSSSEPRRKPGDDDE